MWNPAQSSHKEDDKIKTTALKKGFRLEKSLIITRAVILFSLSHIQTGLEPPESARKSS